MDIIRARHAYASAILNTAYEMVLDGKITDKRRQERLSSFKTSARTVGTPEPFISPTENKGVVLVGVRIGGVSVDVAVRPITATAVFALLDRKNDAKPAPISLGEISTAIAALGVA